MSQHQGMSQQTEVTGTGVFADEEEAGSASRTGVFAHQGSASGSRKRSFGAMLTGTAPLQMLSCCHIHCMQNIAQLQNALVLQMLLKVQLTLLSCSSTPQVPAIGAHRN